MATRSHPLAVVALASGAVQVVPGVRLRFNTARGGVMALGPEHRQRFWLSPFAPWAMGAD